MDTTTLSKRGALGAAGVAAAVLAGTLALAADTAPTPVTAPDPTVELVMTEPGELQVDGAPAKAVINAETTLAAQAGKLYPGAKISVSRYGPRPTIQVTTPSTVTVIADGNRTDVTTTRLKSKHVLADEGLTLNKRDKVTIRRPDDRPAIGFGNGATIRVVRVTHDVTRKTRPVKAKTVTRNDANLEAGTRKTLEPGKAGKQRVRVTKIRYDGKTRRTVTKVLSTTPAVDKVVAVGTKQPTPTKAPDLPTGDGGGLNWSALAKCESGGNPKAYNPAGYYGLYQFNQGTWESVGGKGKPHEASPTEQTKRAQKLYDSRGRSPWPHCGKYL